MRPESIWVPGPEGLVKVRLCEVEWVQAHSDYVFLHTPVRKFLIRGPLSKVAARFAPGEMIRVHRSALVRLASVAGVRRQPPNKVVLRLERGVEVAVGATYRATVLADLQIRTPRR